MFFVRLDGSPNYAMLCNAIPAVVNILLDYVFILFRMGMMGRRWLPVWAIFWEPE